MEPLPEKIRAFVALRIPEAVIAALGAAQAVLKPKIENVSWTRPEAMHLTVHFFGNIRSADLEEIRLALAAAVKPFRPFDIALRGVGTFGNRVIWAGMEGDCAVLKQLASAVRQAVSAFGEKQEERDFSAHVTLGRLRLPHRGVSAFLRAVGEKPFGSWRVDDVELIRSELSPQGAKYTVLAHAPLH